MSSQRPSLPKGTRDFGPEQMSRRMYILDIIRSVFQRYGYQPLETPSMENLSVLTGKYGDEGDQLLFKILNSGDFLKRLTADGLKHGARHVLPLISEKGLRYDLTVPFARYAATHRHELTLPFKRYQIQPVWRADRPQKGRYREFLQCDADVIGSDSPLNEAEILAMINDVFSDLGIDGIRIKLNHRGILKELASLAGQPEKENAFCVAIDKRDKIGDEKVYEELLGEGFTSDHLDRVFPILDMPGTNLDKLTALKKQFAAGSAGVDGIDNIESILALADSLNATALVDVDFALARGLSYYTGAIMEVIVSDGSMGSLSGGGRYDNLTGVFGVDDTPGVGFSLGIDRIYDVMTARNLFDQVRLQTTRALIVTFDDASFKFGVNVLGALRAGGVASELYPTPGKMKKQMTYANRKEIPYVVIIGEDEQSAEMVTVKEMQSGNQQTLPIKEAIGIING